ncbi:MAG TPA: T9SS type A sorting domain-containing protein, partial [Salinimicrobium sp.]|nr:T9SS type A sorting domain-containing protein [Salinimicrobium sp.]
QMGEQIPMDVPGGLTYSDLAGYYRLISAEPDPLGLVTFDTALMPSNGETPDLANTSIPGRLKNMETNQENTAPLPYFSAIDGTWATDATWARPDVWDPPHTGAIEWNIAKTSHNITSGNKDIILLGLISDTPGKLLEIYNPGGTKDETNSGQFIRITHYLHLDGNMDLIGESQLLQDPGSVLEEDSEGWLERDQQGKGNSFVYDYWSSPVSPQGTANNSSYSVGAILLDGTNSASPQGITFQSSAFAADGGRTNPITISTYWIWGYAPAVANQYSEWDHIQKDGLLKTGEGYTMKGTDGTVGISATQNYTLRGKPHNGDFTLNIGPDQNYLIGNPYPSSLDAFAFIDDNLNIFNGALYFWDHFAETSHILKEYVGGYATLTKAGGIVAIYTDARIDGDDSDAGDKRPEQYIPVGQAFLINSMASTGGEIHFKNSQRVYVTEGGDQSIFFSQEEGKSGTVNLTSDQKNTQSSTYNEVVANPKIWLKFHSPTGYHRQVLVGTDPNASDGFDVGYDAPLIENNAEDMYWIINDAFYVIQGVAHLNVDQELSLGIKIKEQGKFIIEIDELKNVPDEMNIYLKDSILNLYHDLREGPYESTAEPGSFNDRFKIVFKKPEPEKPEEPEEPEIITGDIEIQYVNDSREVLVRNPKLHKISRVYLNNILGQQIHVYYNIPVQNEINLPVNWFGSGIYIVKLHSEDGIVSKKVILE